MGQEFELSALRVGGLSGLGGWLHVDTTAFQYNLPLVACTSYSPDQFVVYSLVGPDLLPLAAGLTRLRLVRCVHLKLTIRTV